MPVLDVALLTLMAGMAAFIGAFIGYFDEIKKDWLTCETRHFILAFGGGALLAAVALVLVPRGMDDVPLYAVAAAFVGGAVVFMGNDAILARQNTHFANFLAMMLDFVPEAIVVGAVITQHYNEAVFIAVLIAAQNIPEGFNAFREMTEGKGAIGQRKSLFLMALAGATGIVWGLMGALLFHPDGMALKLLMLFCAGGILYLVFQDVAPHVRVANKWAPALGAVLGYLLGMVGHGLT